MDGSGSPSSQPGPKTVNQRLLALLQAISLAVAEAKSSSAAFSAVLAHICRFMRWPLGHVYIWSDTADALVSSRIWHMTDAAAIAPFREVSEAIAFRRGEGTLGEILESGQALMILDVRDEPMFVRHLPIEEGNIRAYFAFPVKIEGQVAAVLEFFSPESVPPDADMTSIINHVSALLGLAIQRQQTMARLQQSELQLAEAQRTAHMGYWEWDVTSNTVTWSQELYRVFGLSPDDFDVTYHSYLNLVHPDDLEYVQKNIVEAYQNGRAFDYFHRIIRQDGAVRVLHARGRPIYDRTGKIIRLRGTSQDMTEQKETELKLAHTVRQLSALLEIGQAVSSTLDLDVIYDRVLTLVRPLINAEALLLFLYQDEMLEVVAMDRDGIPDMRGMRIPAHTGIAGEVWQSGRSLFLKGQGCVQRLSPILRDESDFHPQAMLAVPVRWHNEAVGVLEAAQRNINAFVEEDLLILETAAAWTAIAIANARQYEQLQRRLNESSAISAITQALIETLELDEVLQLIVTHVHEIVCNADWTTIHLLNPKTNQLELVASAGLDIDSAAYLINVGEGVAGYVMDAGGTINVPDVQRDPRRLPFDLDNGTRSLLVAPIESRRQRLGTISVLCKEPEIFTPDDERLLKVLGVQAGMAIENARLYAAQRRARKLAEKRRERMRHMARRLMQAQEEERARIARELHDESGQALTSLKISLDMIQMLLPDDMGDVKESLQEIVELTDKTMSSLRLLSHNLRPPGLDAYGLHAALAGLCQDYETHTNLAVSYTGVELRDVAPLLALALYRLAQEALTNVVKHAQASQAWVTLAQQGDQIVLTVTDDGQGFTPPNLEEIAPGSGDGLRGMVERLEMVSGQLEITSAPGEGVRLTAVVPLTMEES